MGRKVAQKKSNRGGSQDPYLQGNELEEARDYI